MESFGILGMIFGMGAMAQIVLLKKELAELKKALDDAKVFDPESD
jgi:hypothetical protein